MGNRYRQKLWCALVERAMLALIFRKKSTSKRRVIRQVLKLREKVLCPEHFEMAFHNARHIVLSFFISLDRCATTLELLQPRTSTRGVYKWCVLAAFVRFSVC